MIGCDNAGDLWYGAMGVVTWRDGGDVVGSQQIPEMG